MRLQERDWDSGSERGSVLRMWCHSTEGAGGHEEVVGIAVPAAAGS